MAYFPTIVLRQITTDGTVMEPDPSTVFCPDHKAAMVLFLDRVYGLEDQNFLFHLLDVGLLPDLQAAASLDTVRDLDAYCHRRNSTVKPLLLTS